MLERTKERNRIIVTDFTSMNEYLHLDTLMTQALEADITALRSFLLSNPLKLKV